MGMQLLQASRVVVSVIALPLKLRPRLWCRIEMALQQMAEEGRSCSEAHEIKPASGRALSIVKCMMHDDLEFTRTCLYRHHVYFVCFSEGMTILQRSSHEEPKAVALMVLVDHPR